MARAALRRPPAAAPALAVVLAAALAGCGAAAHTHPVATTREFRERCVRTAQYADTPVFVQNAQDPPRLVHNLLCRDDFAPGQIVDVRVVRILAPVRFHPPPARGRFLMRYTATAPDGTLIGSGLLVVPIDRDGAIGHYTGR